MIAIPETAPKKVLILSGSTYCERNSVTNPSRKTEIVCVNVTIPPRKTAWLGVPRVPTR